MNRIVPGMGPKRNTRETKGNNMAVISSGSGGGKGIRGRKITYKKPASRKKSTLELLIEKKNALKKAGEEMKRLRR